MIGIVATRRSASKVGGFAANGCVARTTVSKSLGDATVTSMRSVPMRVFNSAGVPCATVRPWSSTTTSSAS